MRKVIRVLLIVLVTMGGLATAGLLYVRTTGLVARLEPGALETRIARGVRSLAIPREVSEQPNPVPATPESLADGRAHYADHCAVCHASDGSGETETGQGMWPKAPDMRLSATQDLSDGELFWIIENGIRFTGMPGWSTGTQEGEDASWYLVHFIQAPPGHQPRRARGDGNAHSAFGSCYSTGDSGGTVPPGRRCGAPGACRPGSVTRLTDEG